MIFKYTFGALCIAVICLLLLISIRRSFPRTVQEKSTYSTGNRVSLNVNLLTDPDCYPSFVIWIVTSSAENFASRATLRRAYPAHELRRLSVRRIYLLGSPSTEATQHLLVRESQTHGDILQGDFSEAYRNLTLKHMMGLRWASTNCLAPFLIKTDDDIALNLFQVLKLLRNGAIEKNAISGYVLSRMLPVRTPGNKWFVSKTEFSGDVYPDFLSGWFYLTSLKMARKLVAESELSGGFLWIDDVYVTGILREACGIEIGALNSFYATDYRYLQCCIRGKRKKLACDFIAGPDGGKNELQMEFKEFSAFCRTNCSQRTREESVARTCVGTYEEILKTENAASSPEVRQIPL